MVGATPPRDLQKRNIPKHVKPKNDMFGARSDMIGVLIKTGKGSLVQHTSALTCGIKNIARCLIGVACEERAGVQGGHANNTRDARWPGEMCGDVLCVVFENRNVEWKFEEISIISQTAVQLISLREVCPGFTYGRFRWSSANFPLAQSPPRATSCTYSSLSASQQR